MRVLVTGGAGFIGSHLTEHLVRQGHEVRVLDNLCTGSRENLAAVLEDAELVVGDIRDAEVVSRAVRGVEVILHLAALASVSQSLTDPMKTNSVNVDGTIRLLLEARNAEVRRVVYSSSAAVYGNSAAIPQHEELPTVPTSPYGVSKLAAEHYCTTFGEAYGLETISLRYFNVFGPRQRSGSQYAGVISSFITRLLSEQAPVVYGDGAQYRDFIYVGDVVTANVLAMRANAGFGQVFNVGTGHATSVNQLAQRLMEVTGVAVPVQHSDSRAGEIYRSLASIARARAVFGYYPQFPLTEGLERTIAWWKNRSIGVCAQ